MTARPAALAVLLCAGLLPSCVSDDVTGAAENVLTLQSGTMSDLRRRRGQGPMQTYEVEPAEMLLVLETAARMARGEGGHPVRAVFVAEQRREVVAKERAADQADETSYGPPFQSAMLAVVHPVPGRPDASRVEIHAIQRGPFHKGRVAWERDMPKWIDQVLAGREGVRQIP